MTLTTLSENLVPGNKLRAEHGFSILIETPEGTVLFDTGQSELFFENAQKLKLELSKVQSVVLSHAHYDHVGGLEKFCSINPLATVYVKPDFFLPKYKNERFIGVHHSSKVLSRLKVLDKPCAILPGVWVMPEIPILHEADTHFGHFFTERDGQRVPDTFTDELYLAILEKQKVSVISGCSHRGITNILEAALAHFKLPFDLVLGGFHLKDEPIDQAKQTAEAIRRFNIERIGVSHCTGAEGYAVLRETLGGRIFYNGVGTSLTIGSS
ncbi:MAG: MBL fold metallo-hydrolase [Spirochaetales bacterium]|nr:MBL fold metallo-hydrolase [Spirochaetales bacterium]